MATRWDDIMKILQDNNIEAYSPSTKEGECKSPYVVVKLSGETQYRDYSTDVCYYDVMCYVPKSKYSRLESFAAQVEEVMKKLQPMIMPANQKTPSFYDDTYKAHMISITYRNFKKL